MDKPTRKQNRLISYDYRLPGSYFITLCTEKRVNLFGIELPVYMMEQPLISPMISNRIIHNCVLSCMEKFPNINFDRYVIMPDHLHMIITIRKRDPEVSIPSVMQYFKTIATNSYIRKVEVGILPPFNKKLWQKSYYDHVIRNQRDYNRIWEYIENNPTKWMDVYDREFYM